MGSGDIHMAQGIGLRGSLSLYRSFQGIPMRKAASLLGRKFRRESSQRIAQIRRRAKIGHIGAVFRTLGPAAGIKAFWTSPLHKIGWHDVASRLGWLSEHFPEHVRDFVAMGLNTTTDGTTLIGLAQSPLSDTHLKELLPEITDVPPESLQKRMKNSHVFTAAYVGAQMLLYGPEAGQTADKYARNLHLLPRRNYDHFLDSIAFHPLADVPDRRFESGYQHPKKHRLLILESAKVRDNYLHLFRDATEVTIIDMSDMYGKTTFDDVKIRGVETIQVEHFRTRITRFCSEYHQLHSDTKDAAVRILHEIDKKQPHPNGLFGQAAPHVALDLADQIFFESLKVRALAKLIADPCFDHIVIAHDKAANNPFGGLLSCITALRADPRLEFVSVARTLSGRLGARKTIDAVTGRDETATSTIPQVALAELQRDLQKKIDQQVAQFDSLPDIGRERLLMLTGHNPAYDPSTASTLHALCDKYQISAIFYGSSLSNFLKNNATTTETLEKITPITLSHRFLPGLSDFEDWLQAHFQVAVRTIEQEDLRAVLTTFAVQFTRNALLPGIANYTLMTNWLKRLKTESQLPKIALVTPQRQPKIGVLSEAAREFGIPSLALEPHGLNGNYCRYSKVAMDYYGVISDYFRYTAESDFGIAQDRCRVIGSPRIIAPVDYDPTKAQADARLELTEGNPINFEPDRNYVSFFCQPSGWPHVAKVWANILKASEGLNVVLLLKTHPEESKARVARYMALAAQLGAAERVVHIEGAPDQVIAASDLVLTGYSAAAIDAAVLQTPVVCVTAEDKSYPVDQHTIVHSKLCGDADELHHELQRLLFNEEARAKQAGAFLQAEPQFISGPDDLLRDFVDDIIATPTEISLRLENERPRRLFLDGPFTTFDV